MLLPRGYLQQWITKSSEECAPGDRNRFPPSPGRTSHGKQWLYKARVQQLLNPGPSSPAQSKHPGERGEERRGCLLGPLCSWGLFPWVCVVPQAWGQLLTVTRLRPHSGAWCHVCKPRLSQQNGRELGWAGQGVFAVPSPQESLEERSAPPPDKPARCLGARPQCWRPSAFPMIPSHLPGARLTSRCR